MKNGMKMVMLALQETKNDFSFIDYKTVVS